MRRCGVLSVVFKTPEMHIPPWYWFRRSDWIYPLKEDNVKRQIQPLTPAAHGPALVRRRGHRSGNQRHHPLFTEHQERQEKLEVVAEEARAALANRSARLDDAKIASYDREMSGFLMESEPTETKAFMRSFVKEIAVAPGQATLRYAMPNARRQSNRKKRIRGGQNRRTSSGYST